MDHAFFSKTMSRNVFHVIMKFIRFKKKRMKPIFTTAYNN